MKSCGKLHRERWRKVWISEQQLHCLVQSVYKLTLSIDVVHWLGPLSVRQVLGVSAVLLSWPIGWCSMSFFVWFFVDLFSTMILVLCTSCLNFIGCRVWGLGALDKKEIYHIFVNVIRVLWFLKMTHREVFFTYSSFLLFFCGFCILWRAISVLIDQCFWWSGRFSLWYSSKCFFFIVEKTHSGS